MHGHLNHLCLIGHHVHAHADGQFGGQFVDALLQLLTERLNVAARVHGHRQADGRLAVVVEHRRGRVNVPTGNVGYVRQPVEAVVDPQVHGLKVGHALELPRCAHGHALGARFNHACGGHGVLFLQAFEDVLLVQAQGGQFASREVQVEGFFLLANGHHLAAIGDVTNPQAHVFHVIAQLAHGEAIAGKGVNRAVDITELIVEPRALNALREVAANIADFFAHLIPDIGDGIGFGGVLQKHKHRGLTRPGVALHVVQRVQLFELFLDAVSDLQHGVIDRGTGPFGLDHHGFDGKAGVFCPAQIEVRKEPGQHGDKHQVPDERLVLQGPLGEVERPIHSELSLSNLTVCPGVRL